MTGQPGATNARATFVIYIDESGDEGFSFKPGSSEWFILSAVVTRKASDLQTVNLVDTVRARLGAHPKKPLHFCRMKHEERIFYIDHIARAELRTINILIHKPTITEPEKFREGHRLYFYGVRYLFERASWYCRDHRTGRDTGDGSAEVVFSHRSGMSYEKMKNYLHRLKLLSEWENIRISWDIIDPERITAVTPGKRKGLQIADAVAGSLSYAIHPSKLGDGADWYARMCTAPFF